MMIRLEQLSPRLSRLEWFDFESLGVWIVLGFFSEKILFGGKEGLGVYFCRADFSLL